MLHHGVHDGGTERVGFGHVIAVADGKAAAQVEHFQLQAVKSIATSAIASS